MWEYTPRELAAWNFVRTRAHGREQAEGLSLIAQGSRGEPKRIKKQIRDWTKEM